MSIRAYLLPRLLSLCLLLLLLGCSGAEDDPEGLRVLFVGNSLTYTNDLPAVLAGVLAQADVAVGRIDAVAFPNFGLPDHWNEGTARRRIEDGGWDVVVLQQGPSATEGRPSLLEYSDRFAEVIRAAGAEPALYMVWPAKGGSFDGVAASYRMAAEQVGGLLFPAGDAWQVAWGRDASLALYGADNFHPSLLGTYLAALVAFEALTGLDARDLPNEIPTPNGPERISQTTAVALQFSAHDAGTS